jgi:hypothetical protein
VPPVMCAYLHTLHQGGSLFKRGVPSPASVRAHGNITMTKEIYRVSGDEAPYIRNLCSEYS